MDDLPPHEPDESPPVPPSSEETAHGPRRQVYFVTVEWLDEPHEPLSPERLALALRQTIAHAHSAEPGSPAARFVVRVKADAVTSSVEGTVVHHHHHDQSHRHG